MSAQTRYGAAAFDLTTNLLNAWNPNTPTVYALAANGNTIYIGGDFGDAGGQLRSRIAAVDATTGAVTAWDPNAEYYGVEALAVSGSIVLAGGLFTGVGEILTGGFARIDASTAIAASTPKVYANAWVYSMQTQADGNVVVGGNFTSVDGIARRYIARLHADGTLDSGWHPDADSAVYSLAVGSDTIYAGGNFNHLGDQLRHGIAAVDIASGVVTAWDPAGSLSYSASVTTLGLSGTTLYAGGFFSQMGGASRHNLAAINTATAQATPWNPQPNNFFVDAIVISGSTIYIGGDFNTIGGQTRYRLAALDAVTGLATAWNPTANQRVLSIAVSGDTVYAGGYFSTIGGSGRQGLAALDANTGFATNWDPGLDGSALTLLLADSKLIVGGGFSHIGGEARSDLAIVDLVSGTPTSWIANFDNSVTALAVSGNTLFTGGQFAKINGLDRQNIAALSLDSIFSDGFDTTPLAAPSE
ncbi:MAG: hypothetical protein ABIS07_15080 [Dokdonella sp.]